MITVGQLHLATALIALAAGGWVVLRQKGTTAHRRVGWLYAASMLIMNVTALLIYRLTGTFGPFHVAALASLATLIAGIIPAWRRRPVGNWIEHHYYWMAYSYLGLIAAAVAETATRVPAVQAVAGGPTPMFWTIVVIATIAVFIIGARVIRRRFQPTVGPLRGRYTAAKPDIF
jgi:uncharacterized membrane protein